MKNILTILFCSFNLMLAMGQATVSPQQEHNQKWTNVVMANALIGSKKIGMGLRYKSLYNVQNIIQVGWGTGFDSYSSRLERRFIPITAEVVGDLFASEATPFYMISAGYGIPLKENEDFAIESSGGLTLDISVGYRSKRKSTQPFISVGYRIQHASYTGLDAFGNDNKEVMYKRWAFTLGTFF